MTNELRDRAIDLAASYFANWKAYEAALEYDDERNYRNRYEGAMQMAALLGIEEAEIEAYAWDKWGKEIGRLYEDNHATW